MENEAIAGIFGLSTMTLIVVVVIYFLPTFVSACRSRKSGCAIMTLNIFLGWTFLGWLVALVWALSDDN